MTKAMTVTAKPGSTFADDKRAKQGALYYQKISQDNPALSSAEMNNLISLLLHDPAHFKKMVASLVPVVGKLCSGPLATLFSPDPSVGRMPKSGKVISLENVIANGGGVYIGLDTLSDQDVGRAMGQMVLAALASLAGKNYNFGRERKGFINIFVDEASEITNEQLIQLLNKGRGAGFRIFVATQTLADYEARTGSAAMANQILGNMNSTIMLRTLDVDTQERLSKRLHEVPISYVMKTTATSLGDTTISGAFSLNHGERLMVEDKAIVSPQSFGDLSDLEYFAVLAKGNLVKGRLPILDPPDEGYLPSVSQRMVERASGVTYAADDHAFGPEDLSEYERRAEWEIPAPVEVEAPPSAVAPAHRRYIPFLNWIDVLPKLRGLEPREQEPTRKPPPEFATVADDDWLGETTERER